jgi:hypothetical protein
MPPQTARSAGTRRQPEILQGRRRRARPRGPHHRARERGEQHVRTDAAAAHRRRAEASDGDEAFEAKHRPGPAPPAPRLDRVTGDGTCVALILPLIGLGIRCTRPCARCVRWPPKSNVCGQSGTARARNTGVRPPIRSGLRPGISRRASSSRSFAHGGPTVADQTRGRSRPSSAFEGDPRADPDRRTKPARGRKKRACRWRRGPRCAARVRRTPMPLKSRAQPDAGNRLGTEHVPGGGLNLAVPVFGACRTEAPGATSPPHPHPQGRP